MPKQANVLELIKSRIEEHHGIQYYESIEHLLPLLLEIGLTIPKDKSIRRFFKCLCINNHGRGISKKKDSFKNPEEHQNEKDIAPKESAKTKTPK